MSIAIIGAGPAGLVAAKCLLDEGLEPAVFEQADQLGGQWVAGAPHSGIWRSMRANTSRVLTRFYDQGYPEQTPAFPHNAQVKAYLNEYATRFDLHPRVRLNTRVDRVSRTESGGWRVQWQVDHRPYAEEFDRLIVASGRFNKPRLPDIPGLSSFTGWGGVHHSFEYEDGRFSEMRVLVIGSSISGAELAGEIACDPTNIVYSSFRRPRYVLSKLIGGVPADCRMFNRFGKLIADSVPAEMVAEGLRQVIVASCGEPSQVGGRRPGANALEAGITLSHHYMPFVADGRIVPKPGPTRIEGDAVHFDDGTQARVDAIVCATGFELNLPFLEDGVREALCHDGWQVDLYRHTFHPALPNFAMLGMFVQAGPYFPVLELQARWIASVWSGARSLPDEAEMRAGIETYRAIRDRFIEWPVHLVAIEVAEAAGFEPSIREHPDLSRALLFGPLSPAQFRLDGYGADADARQRVLDAAATFGFITSSDFTNEERAQLHGLAAATGDPFFAELSERGITVGA